MPGEVRGEGGLKENKTYGAEATRGIGASTVAVRELACVGIARVTSSGSGGCGT